MSEISKGRIDYHDADYQQVYKDYYKIYFPERTWEECKQYLRDKGFRQVYSEVANYGDREEELAFFTDSKLLLFGDSYFSELENKLFLNAMYVYGEIKLSPIRGRLGLLFNKNKIYDELFDIMSGCSYKPVDIEKPPHVVAFNDKIIDGRFLYDIIERRKKIEDSPYFDFSVPWKSPDHFLWFFSGKEEMRPERDEIMRRRIKDLPDDVKEMINWNNLFKNEKGD
ncbi:MAG: hypothetical protein J7J92_01470 [Candidatus Aenigmarchaeota archaeon]|nr:hypothetical protein [Candidatus Aenigmarchaeota archaeon]